MPALICASSALVGKTTTRPPGIVKVLALEFNGVFDITFYLSLIRLDLRAVWANGTHSDFDEGHFVSKEMNRCIFCLIPSVVTSKDFV